MNKMLGTLFGYHAWANGELLGKLTLLDRQRQADELHASLRLVDHYHVVARIFAAHLSGTDHGYTSDVTPETPTLRALQVSVITTDRWYQEYVRSLSSDALSEAVTFTFTDGDRGRMTRQEMLLHVALHAAIHRGEVGRILSQLSITPPWDTFAVYLHRSDPSRRRRETSRPLPVASTSADHSGNEA